MNRMRCMLHDSCNQSLLSYLFNGVKERYEKKVFQEQVLHCYSQLKDPSWKTLDAKKGVEDLHTEVIKIVEEVIKSSSNKAIESLWL